MKNSTSSLLPCAKRETTYFSTRLKDTTRLGPRIPLGIILLFFSQIWLCGKNKPNNFKSKKKYMTIKFFSNGKINAKGFKALLTGELFIDNSFKIPFFSKSFPKNQSSKDRRNLDKHSKHVSNNVCVQCWVYERLKCSAEKVQVFLQYKMKIQTAKNEDIIPRLKDENTKKYMMTKMI